MRTTTNILKALTLTLAVIVFAGIVTGQMRSNAASPVQLTVTSASGQAGDDVTISINISANSGLATATFLLKYDTTKLTYKSRTFGPAQGQMYGFNEDYQKEGNTINSKTIYYAPVHQEGITAGGSMLNIKFTIKTGWTGFTPITLSVREFVNIDYDFVPHNITNGSVSIGDTTSTTNTTNPLTSVPATTSPSDTTTASSTTPGGETTVVSTNTEQTTAVPVTVPVEDVIDALGPDADNWDKDYGSLNNEQKEKIKEHYAEQGKTVEVKPDGVYIVDTTAPQTTSAETTNPDDGTGGSRLTQKEIVITVLSAASLIIAVALIVAYVSRKKKARD